MVSFISSIPTDFHGVVKFLTSSYLISPVIFSR